MPLVASDSVLSAMHLLGLLFGQPLLLSEDPGHCLSDINSWETMAFCHGKTWRKHQKTRGVLEVGLKAARSPSNLDFPGCPRRWAGAFHPCCRWPVSPGQYGPFKPNHWITSRGTSRSLHDPTSHGLLKISMDTPCSYTPATVPHSSLAFWVRDFSNHFVLGHLQYSVHPKYCIYISIMYRHVLNHGLL